MISIKIHDFISPELTFKMQHLYCMYSKTLPHMVVNSRTTVCQRLLLFVQSWQTSYSIVQKGWQSNNCVSNVSILCQELANITFHYTNRLTVKQLAHMRQRLVLFVQSWYTSHSTVLKGWQLCVSKIGTLYSELANITFYCSNRLIVK